MPNTYFPFGLNLRAYERDQIGPRPPLSNAIAVDSGAGLNSIVRMQDSTPAGPTAGYCLIFGDVVGNLFEKHDGSVVKLATGFSGNRLGYASYRPNQSVQPWMYVADSQKVGKTNSTGTFYNTGIQEPQQPATAQIGGTQFAQFVGDQPGFGAPFGTGGNLTIGARSSFTPIAIIPDYGTQGEASIVTSSNPSNVAANCVIGETTTGIGVVEAIVAAPTSTTIASIAYDSGTTGMCSIVTAGSVTVATNSVYLLNSGGGNQEYVRVVDAISGPGSASTLRLNTNNTHVATETMTGEHSLRIDMNSWDQNQTNAWGDSYSEQTISTGTGGIQAISGLQGGLATSMQGGGRQIEASDVMHFLVEVLNHGNITNCVITFNIDPTIIDFTTNALQWTIPGASFTADSTWLDLSVDVSTLEGTLASGTGRLGSNTNLSLSTGVNGVQIAFAAAGSITVNYDAITVLGTYGTTVTASEQSVFYCYKYRSGQGAQSNPSPPMRAGIFPDEESVQVQAVVSTDPQTQFIDFYRFGASLLNYTFVGTVPNVAGPYGKSASFVDGLDDLTVANNPLMAFDDYQPFPSIDLPASGVCNVAGFAVTYVSGTPFNTRWGAGSEITINGVVYTLYNRPASGSLASLLQDAGYQTNVPFSIPQPTLLAQPLPSLWGPTDNAGYFFGCGDPLRPGTLYFTKGNNPDSAPDTNQVEVTSPAEPLMNGSILNGLARVYSTERAWWIYPQFAGVLATITGTQGSPWYLIPAISNRGLYARRGLCSDGTRSDFFISKDGIYESPGGAESRSVTDSIYSLFPHENSTQQPITIGSITVNPPDYTNPNAMALSFSDARVYFDYQDSGHNSWTLVLDLRTGMWGVDIYTPTVLSHTTQLGQAIGTLVGCADGSVRQMQGSGTETVTAAIQPAPLSSETLTFHHVKEFNVQYTAPNGLTMAFQPDQGQAMPSQSIPAAATEIKSVIIAPAGKFKLLQWTISGTGPWRMWVDGLQSKVGQWGRSGPYEATQPFKQFAQTKAEQ